MFANINQGAILLKALYIVVLIFGITAVNVQADNIITFGDSITKGTPYLEDREGQGRVNIGGYQPDLADLLKNTGRPSKLYNWGIAGENTISGFLRIDEVLARHPQADYILILEGTNDWPLELQASETVDALEIMINRSRSVGVEPILATLPPATDEGAEKAQAIRSQYNPMIRSLANRRGVLLADMYKALAKNWAALTVDGAHPNRSGYSIMADVWHEALSTPVVQTTAATVDGTNARLNGIIRPNSNEMLRYFFQYGQTANYGMRTETFVLETEAKEASVSVEISELLPETTYVVRMVAVTQKNESIEGNNITFNTGAPSSSGGGGCFILSIQQ